MSRSYSTSGSTTQPTNQDAVSSSVHAGVKFLAVIIGLTAALAVAGAAPATTPVRGQAGALKAIRLALAAGRIDGATANAGRAEIARAAHLVRTLPSGRREHVAVALGRARLVQRPPDGPARARADRPAPGERRLLRKALRAVAEDRHHGCRRPRLPLLPRTLSRVPPARQLRRAERARRRQRRGRRTASRRRVDRTRRLPDRAAASRGSTSSTTRAAAHRGSRAWRRPLPRRRSRARRRSCPTRRRR